MSGSLLGLLERRRFSVSTAVSYHVRFIGAPFPLPSLDMTRRRPRFSVIASRSFACTYSQFSRCTLTAAPANFARNGAKRHHRLSLRPTFARWLRPALSGQFCAVEGRGSGTEGGAQKPVRRVRHLAGRVRSRRQRLLRPRHTRPQHVRMRRKGAKKVRREEGRGRQGWGKRQWCCLASGIGGDRRKGEIGECRQACASSHVGHMSCLR